MPTTVYKYVPNTYLHTCLHLPTSVYPPSCSIYPAQPLPLTDTAAAAAPSVVLLPTSIQLLTQDSLMGLPGPNNSEFRGILTWPQPEYLTSTPGRRPDNMCRPCNYRK